MDNSQALSYLQNKLTDSTMYKEQLDALVLKMKRDDMEQKYGSSIFENRGGYAIYVHPNGERKRKWRKKREDLLDYLYEYDKGQKEVIRVKDVFCLWIEEKLLFKDIKKQSYDRYKSDFNRFFDDSNAICKKRIQDISEDDLKYFIKNTIKDKELEEKAYKGLRTLIRGIFKYAKNKNYTSISITNFFGDLEISKNSFAQKECKKENESFDKKETEKLFNYFRDNIDIWNLGLWLQFYTGMRVGELSVLTWDDIHDDYISVNKTEVKYKDENGKSKVGIEDVTKTEAGKRNIILSDEACRIIEEIRQLTEFDEYVFCNKGKRIRGNTFNKRLTKVCEKLNISHKSTHKIRKTYATHLIECKVPESLIVSQLGHRDILTTMEYYYRPQIDLEESKQLIKDAMKDIA